MSRQPSRAEIESSRDNMECDGRVRVFAREFRPYYRHKYLSGLCFLSVLFSVVIFGKRPLSAEDILLGAIYSVIALLSVIMAKRKLFVLTGVLAIVALRGFIAFAIQRIILALFVGCAATLAVLLINWRFGRKYQDMPMPERYSFMEGAVDIAVAAAIFGGLLFIAKLVLHLPGT